MAYIRAARNLHLIDIECRRRRNPPGGSFTESLGWFRWLSSWAKRILFLADRMALVRQATNAFKAFLPDSSPMNLVTDRHEDGRVYVSTYPTMMNLINGAASTDGERRFGPGHFDLVVIDEAHRSVFQRYKAIFEYFDSLLVGLTATPRDEIDRNTYSLFDLEAGVPTDQHGLPEAVADGYLVPPRAVSVPLKFQREGIRYDDLSDEDKERWDELEWDEEDDDPPDAVGAEAINKWLFNTDTVDKVLADLMTKGQKVAGGDRLGKTIVFAKNQRHAQFISERFDANYPQYRGEFARVITNKTEHAQDLIDKFSIADPAPHIALSVDMLDTGIAELLRTEVAANESVRRRLRGLVAFIEKHKRKIVYTDFEDEIGEAVDVEFTDLVAVEDFERFRRKARLLLVEHKAETAIAKLHQNWPITADDLAELQRILVDSGVGTAGECERARKEAGSFGLFVRRLVGLDRAAAKEAFAEFLDEQRFTANQIEFVNLVIDELTANGVVEPRRLYESPFTDVCPQGPDALFNATQMGQLLGVVADVRRRADAA